MGVGIGALIRGIDGPYRITWVRREGSEIRKESGDTSG